MPEISRFLGMVIAMYHRDHGPPHFHAYYGEFEVTVEIGNGVVTGHFPRRAQRLLIEWYDLHKEELRADWSLARQNSPLQPIPPLE